MLIICFVLEITISCSLSSPSRSLKYLRFLRVNSRIRIALLDSGRLIERPSRKCFKSATDPSPVHAPKKNVETETHYSSPIIYLVNNICKSTPVKDCKERCLLSMTKIMIKW